MYEITSDNDSFIVSLTHLKKFKFFIGFDSFNRISNNISNTIHLKQNELEFIRKTYTEKGFKLTDEELIVADFLGYELDLDNKLSLYMKSKKIRKPFMFKLESHIEQSLVDTQYFFIHKSESSLVKMEEYISKHSKSIYSNNDFDNKIITYYIVSNKFYYKNNSKKQLFINYIKKIFFSAISTL